MNETLLQAEQGGEAIQKGGLVIGDGTREVQFPRPQIDPAIGRVTCTLTGGVTREGGLMEGDRNAACEPAGPTKIMRLTEAYGTPFTEGGSKLVTPSKPSSVSQS